MDDPIPLDDETLQRLIAPMAPVEVCDASGKVVGQFVPTFVGADHMISGLELSDDELTRRLNAKEPRVRAADVLSHVRRE